MRPQPIKIPFETLTPIWTGDAGRKTTYIKETSIIGGLRFWTEAVIRTLGKEACNITGDNPCILDKDMEIEDKCGVCQIFGCTGLGKSFSLRIKGNTTPDAIGDITFPKIPTAKKDPKWYLSDPGRIAPGNNKLEMVIQPVRNLTVAPELLLSLILMLKWGTLGAKDQFMHGMIKADIDQELIDRVKEQLSTPLLKSKNGLKIEDFFFFSAELKNYDKKIPFQIRYAVRNCFRKETNKKSKTYNKESDLRHYFCGVTGNNNTATKYNIGITKDKKLFGWGYFPKTGSFSGRRNDCLNILQNQIALHPDTTNPQWREFDSDRDTDKICKDKREYILNMIEGGWK